MKPSRFNHIIRQRGRMPVFYNSRRHRFLELDQIQTAIYGGLAVPITRNLMNLKDPGVESLVARLTEGQFMVGDSVDELAELELLSNLYRHDQRRLRLWIQVTSRCSRNCTGCPYAGDPRDLSAEAQEALLDLVGRRAPGLRELQITWWGGEPLLAWPVVVRLDRHIGQLAQSHRFAFTTHLITNSLADELADAAPASLARTFYSLESVDRPRAAAGGSVYLTNFRVLAERKQHLPPGARIRFINDQTAPHLCHNLDGHCRAAPDFNDEEIDVLRGLVAEGFRVENLPQPQSAACQAVDPQSYIVDAGGRFFRCWGDLGDQSRSLDPASTAPLAPQNFRWLAWNPFRQQHCQRCNILPWCLGGCPAKPVGEECGHWRFAHREMLKLLVMANRKGAI